jgi:hypothetical protein
VSHDDLIAVGRERLAHLGGRGAVVANRGEETGPAGEQVAWLLTGDGEPTRAVGKGRIAAAIADHLEREAAAGRLDPAG